jgi:oxidase EvaA
MDQESLFHTTQRYFSVIAVESDGHEHLLINQPEIGILGYLLVQEEDETYWLVQKKMEPGNVGLSQMAPTVQATVSNYQRVHGGADTPYLDFFIKDNKQPFNVVNSEQGSRFLNKFNRNAKIVLKERVPIDNDLSSQFTWVSNHEMRDFLRSDYFINTDARSVISCGGWDLVSDIKDRIFLNDNLPQELALALNRSYLQKNPERLLNLQTELDSYSSCDEIGFNRIPLSKMSSHSIESDGIYDVNNQRVIGYFDVHMPTREVTRWQQPLLESSENIHCVILIKVADGVAYIGLRPYSEVGFKGRVEYGPTYQSGNGRGKHSADVIEKVLDKVDVLLDVWQSDEGGRFYQNICRYTLAYYPYDKFEMDNNVLWLTAYEVEAMTLLSGRLSNELRTLLSLLLSFS